MTVRSPPRSASSAMVQTHTDSKAIPFPANARASALTRVMCGSRRGFARPIRQLHSPSATRFTMPDADVGGQQGFGGWRARVSCSFPNPLASTLAREAAAGPVDAEPDVSFSNPDVHSTLDLKRQRCGPARAGKEFVLTRAGQACWKGAARVRAAFVICSSAWAARGEACPPTITGWAE